MTKPALRRLLALAGTLLLTAALGGGCHRNVEEFTDDPVAAPDLSKIFPEGAERAETAAPTEAAAAAPALPPSGRGTAPAGGSGDTGPPMTGVVKLPPDLADRAPGGAVLFVFARTQPGMPPTAVKRVAGASLPFEFSLGPEDRMIEAFPFTGPFTITARLDGDGNAMTREPGDLQGSSEGHMPGDEGIELLLDEVL